MTTAVTSRTGQSCPARPRIGVSICLLGEQVRFNGGHSRCRFLTEGRALTLTGCRPAPKWPSGWAARARHCG
jgi:hypothetical protein